MNHTIKIQIETCSNLFIGGAPSPFEIGGIDAYTITTHNNKPYIPASTIKGALRNIIKEDNSEEANKIKEMYQAYIQKDKEKVLKHMEENKANYEEETIKRIEERYKKDQTQEALFGIEGFNQTPKVMIEDFYLKEDKDTKQSPFSIDAKTSLQEENNELKSHPRTYKTVTRGVKFEGEIHFYKIDQLGEEALTICKKYIVNNLNKFNEGIYRLGNSKSRGYGKIKVKEV